MITSDPYGPYWIHAERHVYQYTEGTLILDIMDTETRNLVWRGWAVSAIDEIYESEEIDRLVKTAIEKIFDKFPSK